MKFPLLIYKNTNKLLRLRIRQSKWIVYALILIIKKVSIDLYDNMNFFFII